MSSDAGTQASALSCVPDARAHPWVGVSCSYPDGCPSSWSSCSQFMSPTSFIASQPCADPSYGPPTATSSFLPKTGDFPQVGTSSHSHPSSPMWAGGPCLALAALAGLWWSCGLYLGRPDAPSAPTRPESSQIAAVPARVCGSGFPAARELGGRPHPCQLAAHAPGLGCGAASWSAGSLSQTVEPSSPGQRPPCLLCLGA